MLACGDDTLMVRAMTSACEQWVTVIFRSFHCTKRTAFILSVALTKLLQEKYSK